MRELIRYDRDRSILRESILASADAEFTDEMDANYFDLLRETIRAAAANAPAA